jgi:hypothetical protein
VRHKRIGVGEGWRFAGVTRPEVMAFEGVLHSWRNVRERALFIPDLVDPDDLDRAGYDTFVNPYGRVFVREPALASALTLRASKPQERAL